MKAMVDRENCIGCGLCAYAAPEVFQLDGGTAAVLCGEIAPEDKDAAREARDHCPVSVISLEE